MLDSRWWLVGLVGPILSDLGQHGIIPQAIHGAEKQVQTEPGKHPVPAVAAVIIDEGKILLIKRGAEPSKGKWSIPGGRLEWSETLVEALKREVREETGLEIEVGKVAGVFDLIIKPPNANHITLNSQRSTLNVYHYVLIDYLARAVGGTLAPGDDADDARWVPISSLDEYELTAHLRERLREMGLT